MATHRRGASVSKQSWEIREETYQNISGVGDGSDDSSGNHKLFPGLSDVDDVNSLFVAIVYVWVHQVRAVICANLHLIRLRIDE